MYTAYYGKGQALDFETFTEAKAWVKKQESGEVRDANDRQQFVYFPHMALW